MQLQKIILLMGPPGSGKGTQTKLLSERLGFAYFSTGQLSREYAKQDTELGKRIKGYIDNGIILPIDIINEIFITKLESLADAKGIILDGYPRTIDQAQLLEQIMTKYQIKQLDILFLEVDKDNLLERMNKRAAVERRADDDPAVMQKRFEEYTVKTAPVKEYYEAKGLLKRINGDQDIEKVHQDILSQLSIQ